MRKVILDVPDISCGHCAVTIANALTPQAGVTAVKVNIPDHEVLLDFDEGAISLEQVKEILAGEEYPVEGVRPAA